MTQIDLALKSKEPTYCSFTISLICFIPSILITAYIRGLSNLYCIIAERNGFAAGDNNSDKVVVFYIFGLAFPLQAGITPDGEIKVKEGLADCVKVNAMAQSCCSQGSSLYSDSHSSMVKVLA